MAWTQTDRDALAARVKEGVLTVEYEGRRVTYQNLADMRALLGEMDSQIAAASGSGTRSYATFTRD
jgi:protein tyrosine phosphatase (PTP) superfamily phosphohydrolase (DUF442 family)